MTGPNEVAERLDRAARDALASGEAPRIDYDTARQAADMLKRLSPTEATEPMVERVASEAVRNEVAHTIAESFARRPWLSMATDTEQRLLKKSHGLIPPFEDGELTIEGAYAAADRVLARLAALSSSISNAEAGDGDPKCAVCGIQNRNHHTHLAPFNENYHEFVAATEDSGEVVQADRDAAAQLLAALCHDYPSVSFFVSKSHVKDARQGRCDEFKLVQAFKRYRHRLSALSQSPDSGRFITTWRKTDNVLEWDHYVSESRHEADRVVGNLKAQGVRQYHTFALGAVVDDLSDLLSKSPSAGERA